MDKLQELRLEAEVSEMLIDITNLGDFNDIDYGDLMGILEAKAREVIKKVKQVG